MYQFGAKDSEAAVNAKLRCHCEGLDFPGASPIKYSKIVRQKGIRNLYALVKEETEQPKVREPIKKVKSSEDNLLPEEKNDLTYLFYKNNIKRQMLDSILDCHPSFFEQLVVNLPLEMGYGSDELSGRVLGKFHDGAMQDVHKGVFITTFSFIKEASIYAEKQQQKSLKLIDGTLLAEFMIKYGIGLEKIQTYTVYKINEDFFK